MGQISPGMENGKTHSRRGRRSPWKARGGIHCRGVVAEDPGEGRREEGWGKGEELSRVHFGADADGHHLDVVRIPWA